MKNRFSVGWGYFVELVAAVLLLVLFGTLFEYENIAQFVKNTASDFIALGLVMLAFSSGFLFSMHTKAETKFYRWLNTKGALNVYQNATGFCVGLSIILVFGLIVVKETTVMWFQLSVFFLLVFSAINMVTLTLNIIQFMRLNSEFARRLDDE